MSNLKKLTKIEKEKLIKFKNSLYADKEKLRLNNPKKYNNLITLQERHSESLVVISHQKYRQASCKYSNTITNHIDPAFFITIKYIESIASSPERVISMFSNIKEYLTRNKNYLFQHHIEKGLDGSYHSHVFVSSLKNKDKQAQIEWFDKELKDYRNLNKFSICNGCNSIDVREFNNKELNLQATLRTNYVSKSDTKQYLSLDISPNTSNPYAL